jgi:hypothetical protein
MARTVKVLPYRRLHAASSRGENGSIIAVWTHEFKGGPGGSVDEARLMAAA